MQRTPPSATFKCASNPDIPNSALNIRDTDCFVNLRKRKQPESDMASSVVEVIEQKINEQLVAWKNRLDTNIAETIRNAVNATLEHEMSKLTSSINNSLKDITTRLDDIEKSITYSGERQDNFESRLKLFEEKVVAGSTVNSQIAALENKIESMEQQARQYNIEIANFPDRRNEKLITLLEKIGAIIKHPIKATDILSAHRVPHFDQKNQHPKNVIVKLSSKILRDNIVLAARAVRGVRSDQLSISGTPCTIYLNEHLTPKNKQLFRLCRVAAKKHNYKYTWIKHGTVLVRQTDSSPIFAIRNEQDIDKIK
ncbi:unnamed protein product [Parnassius apollo]|uniref:(apollo) hypothetical protein n=1 Tax=Parnassius apollo TaxID=110799 RepID=A0A8S3XAJ4_PARAO|nr:unnamed protein product [Parnassius apollo]